MRNRLSLWLAPVVLAGTLFLATPAPTLAANGLTETGTTTYEVVPDKGLIRVTIQISLYNGKPDTTTATGTTYYFWKSTEVTVEVEAGAVSASSNAGAVSQVVRKTDKYYRLVELDFPAVYYGQTRVVTVAYTIPAAPHAPGGFRAVAAYASLCASGNGYDTGSVSLVIPDGFAINVDSGGDLTKASDAGGKQVYSSGIQSAPYKFWSCLDAENADKLTHTPMTINGQEFDIEGWPEDPTWNADLRNDVSNDVQSLESMTGLSMPGGTIDIIEAGDWQLGEYGGMYSSATTSAWIPETLQADTVAHELSHIWFNREMFHDKWVSEGLAGYSEKTAGDGNFTPCADPGAYPGTGSPNLMTWRMLDNNATTQEQAVSDYQYAASCYIWTNLAQIMGPDSFKSVMKAAADREMAYLGATPGEKMVGGDLPLTAKEVLDLIDERGLVPAGITDLDLAQTLLSKYGIFSATTLAGRSEARAAYLGLETAAKNWKLPLAVREPMTQWDFSTAGTAMATAQSIIDKRDSIQNQVAGLSLDGTSLQTAFESAATQADLDKLLVLIEKEADAATRIDRATKLRDSGGGLLQTIGLLGTDIQTPLKQAKTDLADVKPDSATADAQTVIEQLDRAGDQGIFRLGVLLALLLAIAFVVTLLLFLHRRRTPATALAIGPNQEGPIVNSVPGFGPNPYAGDPAQWPEPPLERPVAPAEPPPGPQYPMWQTATPPAQPLPPAPWQTATPPPAQPLPSAPWQTATPPPPIQPGPWQAPTPPAALPPAPISQPAPVLPTPLSSSAPWPTRAPAPNLTYPGKSAGANDTPWEMPGLEEIPETTQPAEATEATQATQPAGEDPPSTDLA